MFVLVFLLVIAMAYTPLAQRMEQRATIKFLQKSGQTVMQIWRALHRVYGAAALGKTQVRVWFDRFKTGDMTTPTKDSAHPGRPRRRLQHAQTIQDLLATDSRMSLDDLSHQSGLSRSSVHRLLKKDLKLTKLSAKFVPRILTQDQKEQRVNMCRQNLDLFKADTTLMEKVITTDETWIPLFDPVTKQASAEWRPKGSVHPQKALRARVTRKTMLVLFFDTMGVVHLEFLPQRMTVNGEYWVQILSNLKESIRKKQPIMWRGGFDGQTDRDFILHMDNATPHTGVDALAFYGENNLLAHPPYSPDLAPCDYWAFPTLKSKIRGTKFQTINEAQREVRRVLHATPRQEFEQAIYDMPIRWSKCCSAGGEYFEGSNHTYDPADLPPESAEDSEQSEEDSD